MATRLRNSSYDHHVRTTYVMMDKISGKKVGFVTLGEGQDVPYWDQVELRLAGDDEKLIGQDLLIDDIKDKNGNKLKLNDLVPRLVSRLVDMLHMNSHWPGDKKNALKVKLSEFIAEEIDSIESGQKVMTKIGNNDLTETDFLPNKSESFYLMKPFKVGWLRRVTLIVTGAGTPYVSDVWYVTPPDISDGTRHELRDKKQIEKYLMETDDKDLKVEDFDTRMMVLGLPSGFESFIRIIPGYNPDDFTKPFMLGWLRKVAIRLNDSKVTCAAYVTPPDSTGKRLRLRTKKVVTEYLDRIDSKDDLEVEDFVFALKVLGVSARFEVIRYTGQENIKDIQRTREKKVMDIEQSDIPNDNDSSYDTIVDSSSSDSSDDSSDISDGEVDISVCLDAIVPVLSICEDLPVAEVGASQDLSTDIADENGLPTVFSQVQDFDSEKATGSCSPLSSSKMSPAESSTPGGTSSPSVTRISWYSSPAVTSSPAVSYSSSVSSLPSINSSPSVTSSQAVTYSPAITSSPAMTSSPALTSSTAVTSSPAVSYSSSLTSSPAPITSLPVLATNKSTSPSSAAVAMATVTMVSTDHSSREGGRRMQKMMIKCKVKIIKGMEIFGRRFGQDFRSLRFFVDDGELTGEELAGTLDGDRIRVEGLD